MGPKLAYAIITMLRLQLALWNEVRGVETWHATAVFFNSKCEEAEVRGVDHMDVTIANLVRKLEKAVAVSGIFSGVPE